MRLHALQYLRAFAALAVVYSHIVIQVEPYQEWLLEFGSFGVDIFFVISGFIMIYISKPTDTPTRFFINRVRRVVPLYWFFTLLMGVILLLAPSLFKTTVFEWDALIMSLAFIPHFSVAQPDVVWPIVAPGWSLNYEMYFYFLFAVSLMFAAHLRVLFITAVISMVFIAAHLIPSDGAFTLFFRESMVFDFVTGMLLAVAWKKGFRLTSNAGWLLILLGIVLLFARLPIPRFFEFGLPSILVVTGCLFINVKHYPTASLVGDASYALYLSHIFTLGALRKLLPPILGDVPFAAYLFVFISLIICTIVSVVVHKFVDNWLLRSERFDMCRTARQREA